MCQATTDTLHPFEKAGLGTAPFRFIGHYRDVGPKPMGDGITMCGAPGQPMGTCDYCSQGIADCYQVKSADGKQFVVGCDCISKLAKQSNMTASQLARDPVYQELKRAINKVKTTQRHAREAAKIAEGQAWATANEAALRAIPHPSRGSETMWDTYEWYMGHAGNKGKLDILKFLKAKVEAAQS